MGTAANHLVPDRIKPSFVIFDIRALWRSGPSVRVPGCQNYKWRLSPVWHKMIYSCTHIATVGVKGLNLKRHYYCDVFRCGDNSGRRSEPSETRLGGTLDQFHVHCQGSARPRRHVATQWRRVHLFWQHFHRHKHQNQRRGNQQTSGI